MPLKMPNSMDECFYFTNRIVEDGKGSIIAWVYRPDCPKCKKAKIGKPVEKGKVKKRADYYVCNVCGYQVPQKDIDPSLKIEVQYKCPYCGFEGETTTEYKRRKFMGVDAYVFTCQKCGKKIGITKKMKDIKKKEGEIEEAPEED